MLPGAPEIDAERLIAAVRRLHAPSVKSRTRAALDEDGATEPAGRGREIRPLRRSAVEPRLAVRSGLA